jgi:hypothetical protein
MRTPLIGVNAIAIAVLWTTEARAAGLQLGAILTDRFLKSDMRGQ